MTNLECSVSSCAYYCDELCSRGGIQVCGRSAHTNDETSCTSYEEKSEDGELNSINMSCSCAASDIACDAENCVHQCDGKCEADCICVENCGCENANCKSETKCGTFENC